MQSPENLAEIAAVDRELVRSRTHAYFELLGAGRDFAGLMTFFADDVVFELVGNWSIFPHAGRAQGKDALVRAITTIYIQVENLGSTLHDLVIDGDRVAVRRNTRLRSYGTGRVGDVAIADFARIRDGLIVEFTEIVDSLAIAKLEAS